MSVYGIAFVLLTGARGAAAGISIRAAGAAAIAEALKVNKTVTTINMASAWRAAGDCAARDIGGSVGGVAFMLLTGARGAAPVNSIGESGAAVIAEALTVNKTVTTINLAGACRAAGARPARGGSVGGVAFVLLTGARGAAAACDIGAAGAAAIAEALRVNCIVTDISLQCACRRWRARMRVIGHVTSLCRQQYERRRTRGIGA